MEEYQRVYAGNEIKNLIYSLKEKIINKYTMTIKKWYGIQSKTKIDWEAVNDEFNLIYCEYLNVLDKIMLVDQSSSDVYKEVTRFRKLIVETTYKLGLD